MSLTYYIQNIKHEVVALSQDEDGEVFSKAISQLIEDKFSFSASEIALERKPKADKGV